MGIRFTGFGGQGVILMGIVLARAAVLHDQPVGVDGKVKRKSAIQTQSYGPSARGGHSRCDVKISTEEMHYPFVEIPDYLVIMSRQGYKKYIHDVKPETKIVLDPDLVTEKPSGHVFRINAIKSAEEMGTRIVANVVMLGAFREISNIVTYEAMEKAMLEIVPKPTYDLNKNALKMGRKLGEEAIHGKDKD